MTYYAIEIEQCPGFGFQGGPEFDTLIRPLENGRNRRKPRRYIGLHHYTSPMNNISVEAARAIKKVHMAMLGAAHTFRFLDFLDFEATDAGFGVGDGVTVDFQLKNIYNPGGGAQYLRDITKPDTAFEIQLDDAGVPIIVKVAGVTTAVTVNSNTGIVTFSSPPALGAALTWSGRFWVPVRFNRDDLPFSIDSRNGSVFITNGTLELIEELNE